MICAPLSIPAHSLYESSISLAERMRPGLLYCLMLVWRAACPRLGVPRRHAVSSFGLSPPRLSGARQAPLRRRKLVTADGEKRTGKKGEERVDGGQPSGPGRFRTARETHHTPYTQDQGVTGLGEVRAASSPGGLSALQLSSLFLAAAGWAR
jgi:hypothetical protein